MNIDKLFNGFKQRRVLVIGDVMIDAYLEGNVNRVSPEAPVPIVSYTREEQRLGGAANVALNLLSLGAKVSICSVVGNDDAGIKMLKLMKEHQINTDALISTSDRKTTIKTRVIGNNQQLLRVDNEQEDDINSTQEKALLKVVETSLAKGCDAIIFEDYNKGVLTDFVIKKTIELANKYGVVTTVDPKSKNLFSYRNVTLFKPNLKELIEGVGRNVDVKNKSEFELAVKELNNKLNAKIVFVTLSEHGVYIQNNKSKYYIPAHIRSIADVSGAGDTVISVATLALLEEGLELQKIAEIANLAGGLVCEEVGVVAINAEKLRSEIIKTAI